MHGFTTFRFDRVLLKNLNLISYTSVSETRNQAMQEDQPQLFAETLSSGIIDIFLCHNGADKAWVEALAEQIESETDDGSDTGRRLRVFYDKWDIDLGQNVVLRINEGLEKARFVAVIISPDSLKAPWPTFEWTHLVADDPINRKERLIPIFFRDGSEGEGNVVSLPAPFLVMNWIDFRDRKSYKKSVAKLIRRIRGLPPERGKRREPIAMLQRTPNPALRHYATTASAPDPVSAAILGNLLPVISLPKSIWCAPTDARNPKDIKAVIKKSSPFILKEEKLYSFEDLSRPDSCFASLVDCSKARTVMVGTWAQDLDRVRWLIQLCNLCLKNYLGSLPIRQDEKGRYYFLPNYDGSSRQWRNLTDPQREVAAKKISPASGAEFWVHQGAWLSFKVFGDNVFLLIDPTYVFTTDGRTSLGGKKVGSLAVQWTAKQRNAAILRSVVFWARTLAGGKAQIKLDTGSASITLSGIPAIAHTAYGIEDEHIAFGSLIGQLDDELGSVASSVNPQLFVEDDIDD